MSRLIFEARRRIPVPSMRKGTITVEPPPELPRLVPPSLLRRVLPYLIVMLIVGMIVALVATGMRLISPTTLFFPFVLLLAATAMYRGTDGKVRTEEIDAERADYLRYLSVIRDNVRTHAGEQRAALDWSHPDPTLLAEVPGTRRQWERDPHDADFLVVRTGLHDAPLNTTLRVKDTADEVDLEPVSHSTLRGLLDVQRTVRAVPAGLDIAKVSRITVLGAPEEVRAALRAWIAQAVTWHDPAVLGVALVTPELESEAWSWLKWLPHCDVSGDGPTPADGAGPARYLADDAAGLRELLAPVLDDRPSFEVWRRRSQTPARGRRRRGRRPRHDRAAPRRRRRHAGAPLLGAAASRAVRRSRTAHPADRRRKARALADRRLAGVRRRRRPAWRR